MVAARNAQAPWPCDPDGAPLYPGNAKALPRDERARRMNMESYALRLDMAAATARAGRLTWRESGQGPSGETGDVPANSAAWGDVVLARKDVPVSYHLAVVIDDAAQGVTDVVRGQDLFHATSVHRLLQALLRLPSPRYHHHRLILDEDGKKLSKSSAATGLRELRAGGRDPRRHPAGGWARLTPLSVAWSTRGWGKGDGQAQAGTKAQGEARAADCPHASANAIASRPQNQEEEREARVRPCR
jgi:glutamyl-Q tRNA(Asp) synthetase